ncbi:MAG: class I SAM-dependent methyltransferase [Actinobacteria bacterium]|nr:class I SAM-dependent methyltransferase [Actinomycetota bacterium]MBV8561578.1 class I SAM-dependent methyltransferase [Actinomycetota bacterium]
MPWYYAVAERDHVLQNPTSPEKIRQLGERLRLGPGSRVLDMACGMAGPAVLLADTFGCRVVGVERAHEFAAEAKRRVEDAGLAELVEIVEGDAAAFPVEPGTFDAALCLGASFVWSGLEGTLAALGPVVRAGGHVVVGEPYWRVWPLPDEVDDIGAVPLRDTVGRIERAGLKLVTLIDSSLDDWDTYESLHWRAAEEWLAENPGDPDAPGIRTRYEQHREAYLAFEREALGWAIFAARKP